MSIAINMMVQTAQRWCRQLIRILEAGWFSSCFSTSCFSLPWVMYGIRGKNTSDGDNPKNGSERMPTIVPYGNFTSFLGDGNMYWVPDNFMIDQMDSYSGTWGIGARIRNLSFVENLKHSLTVAYWGGTNAPGMAKYMGNA